jgi:hypothetical protein
MSTWVVPIVVCLSVGLFCFFMGRWSCRSNTKEGTPSTSTNSVRDAICPDCRDDAIVHECDNCGHKWGFTGYPI